MSSNRVQLMAVRMKIVRGVPVCFPIPANSQKLYQILKSLIFDQDAEIQVVLKRIIYCGQFF
jgi:hypothetical protein